MNTKELRQKYLEFFESKGHKIIPSASLIPENDPTVLFTTAGMHPLVPYLMGEKHPEGVRLTDVQKCIRTGDIDDVGDQWHLTFFEMLGNWSLNDYWKEEALTWSFEFLTKELNIPIEKLAVTVFEGDDDAPFDEESFNIWKNLGIPQTRIYKYNKKENWWGPAGVTGPCGPDSEMFYITDKEACGSDCQPSCSCGKYVEIWNDVFMEYHKDKNGNFNKAENRNVDTGMGVERVTAILNNFDDNYHGDSMWPIVEKIEELSGKKYTFNKGNLGFEEEPECWKGDKKAIRIISDHIRAAVMIMGDSRGVAPSNVDQGYVVRKLVRRAVRYGRQIGIKNNFCNSIAEEVINIFTDVYPEIKKNEKFVLGEMEKEEGKFRQTLEQGIKEFEKGIDPFVLFTTYGFPIEITEELAEEEGLKIDRADFDKKMKKHQDLSRAGAEQKFKGGLADAGVETTRLHTATHLLHMALRKVLGEHVEQKGSNITAERLRFDFSHGEKMTDEQKQEVEKIINDAIEADYPVTVEEMTVEQAKELGAIGLFGDKYEARVKVYTVGDPESPFSREICGGPHVEHTSELGSFKIKKEEASSAGIRRIKAILI
ncbi:alanine--tRNA ligase [Patescibacteria group bacterium]|nr:alanine--tRNA ligase [Patescibacteria group bacterium]